jgi:hypothetical protein
MNETAPTLPWPRSSIPGPKVLLAGAVGSGKTWSIRTLLPLGYDVFIIATEPGIHDVLGDTDESRLHWHYIKPADPTWDAMRDNAKKINMMSFEDLSKLKSGLNKSQYGQFIELLNTMANFKCDRCEREFGPVDGLTNRQAFVLDSLSGLNIMAMDLVTGAKPVKAIGEWGVAMDNEERLITKMCSATNCLFVLTAHLELEVDEMLGMTKLMPGALGRKLAPKIPRFFSDVIHCKMNDARWTWSTITPNVDVKARNLPYADGMDQDFALIVEAWRKKHTVASDTRPPAGLNEQVEKAT